MHKAPYRTSPRLRRTARTACFTAAALTGFLTAAIAAGAAVETAVHAVSTAGPADPREQGAGAEIAGFSVGVMVLMAMRIAYVLHERRRQPDKTYSIRHRGGKNEDGLTRTQYLRRIGSAILLFALLGCAGLLLQLEFG
jgi:hypothetical protein